MVCFSNPSSFIPPANFNLQSNVCRLPGWFSLLAFLLLILLHKTMTKTSRRITTRQPTPIATHTHHWSPSSWAGLDGPGLPVWAMETDHGRKRGKWIHNTSFRESLWVVCAHSQKVYTNKHKQYAQLGQAGFGTSFEIWGESGGGVVGRPESKTTAHLAFASGHIGSFCCGDKRYEKTLVEASVLPLSLMDRLSVCTPSWENMQFQIPSSEETTGFRWTVPDSV